MLHLYKLLNLLVCLFCYLICFTFWLMDSANSHNHNYNLRSITNHTVIDMLQPTDLTDNIPSTSSISSTSAHDLNHSYTSSQQADLTRTSTFHLSVSPLLYITHPNLHLIPTTWMCFFIPFMPITSIYILLMNNCILN